MWSHLSCVVTEGHTCHMWSHLSCETNVSTADQKVSSFGETRPTYRPAWPQVKSVCTPWINVTPSIGRHQPIMPPCIGYLSHPLSESVDLERSSGWGVTDHQSTAALRCSSLSSRWPHAATTSAHKITATSIVHLLSNKGNGSG